MSGFDQDQVNNCKSLRKHDVNQIKAGESFLISLMIVPDMKHSAEETRLYALGQLTTVGFYILALRCGKKESLFA